MARFRNVLEYLGLDDAEGRKECPLCGSSDGLHVTLESTREGEVHCYSCGQPTPGTGVELYRRQEGVSKAEAMEAFGIDTSNLASEVKQKEEEAPRPTTPNYTDEEWKERCRAWQAMNTEELRLRDDYRARRARAQTTRDQKEFDRWQQKLDDLFDYVLQREMRG